MQCIVRIYIYIYIYDGSTLSTTQTLLRTSFSLLALKVPEDGPEWLAAMHASYGQ